MHNLTKNANKNNAVVQSFLLLHINQKKPTII